MTVNIHLLLDSYYSMYVPTFPFAALGSFQTKRKVLIKVVET